jgi:hypothetical protein
LRFFSAIKNQRPSLIRSVGFFVIISSLKITLLRKGDEEEVLGRKLDIFLFTN